MAGPNDVILNVGAQLAPDTESKLQQSFARIEKNMRFVTPFATATRNVRDFNSELDRANQRVITLGASFAVLSTSIRVFKDIISSTIAVEKALTDINSVFQLSTKSLDQFSRGLFNVARETSQSFEKTAEAAKEFSRQGLSAEETLKRTRDAMVLTRLASLDTEEAVSTLTASINGFQKAALDSTQIVNKLATVDAAFAVSSKDLAQGLARAGAAASDAGVSFDQLIGLITSAQQTTARGGTVIGNSLKTIFTRVERKDTIEAFEALGVAVTDLQGNILPAIGLLQNFASTYDKLGGTVKKQAAELVGGVYQINILKALLSDLEKGSNSVAEKAAKTSANAADEAIKRNEALNKSLAAVLQQSQTTYQQIGSKIGDLGIAGASKTFIGAVTNNPVSQWLANAGDADTNSLGEKAAAGFIKGFGNALVFGLGPSLVLALGKISLSVFSKVQRDFSDLIGANQASKQQAAIQEQIVSLYSAGDDALKRQLLTMGSLAERAALVESILSRGAARQAAVASELNVLSGAVLGIRKTPRAAGGYDPFSAEAAAIRAGVGGASPNAKPVMLQNFAYGGGITGPIVANTSEYMVKTPGGSAIYNQAMIQKMGLPPGATPIAAGGYIPNMAAGGSPGYSDPDYYKNLFSKSSGPSYPFGVQPGAQSSSSPVTGSASGQGFGQFLKYAAAPVSSGYDEAMKAKQAASLAVDQMMDDFEKAKKERAKQDAIEVKMTELKQKQLEEMAKQLDNQKKTTGMSASELKQQEKINDMLRKAEAISMEKAKEALLPIVQKVQAQAAVDAIPEEKKAVWLTGLPRGEYDVRQERIKSGWAKFETEEKLRQSVPFFKRTDPEKYFKRDFKNLSLKDLEYASGIQNGVSSNVSDRFDVSQAARGAAFRPVVERTGVNYAQLNDALRASRGVADGKTIQEQFNNTIQDLLKSGKGMNTAYNAAIAEIMKETTNRSQINRIIRESIPVNVEFQNRLAASNEQLRKERRMAQLDDKTSQMQISRQATLNDANQILKAGGPVSSLSPQQRAVYYSSLKMSAAQSLGFGGDLAGAMSNPAARNQILALANQQMTAMIAQNGGGTIPGAPGKGGFFSGIRQTFKNNPLAGQLALSMGLPFLGGAIPDGLGGTGGGMALGGLSSALSGAGTGAAIGSFIPGVGTLAGAGIGAAIGGVSGALSKLTVSFEEAAKEINDLNANLKIQSDAVMSSIRFSEEAIRLEAEGGKGTREMKVLEKSRLESIGAITDPKIRMLMSGSAAQREEGKRLQNEQTERLSMGGNIYSSFTGAMEMGKGFSDSMDATSRISNSLVPFFKDKTKEQLSDYSEAIQRDPIGAIRSIMSEQGISEDKLNRAIPGELNPNRPTAQYLTYGAGLDAIAKARSIQRSEALGSVGRKSEVEKMRGLLSMSEKYRQQSEFEKISFGANQSIFGVQKEIALSNPRLSELDKIGLQSYYGQTAASNEYQSESKSQLSSAKSNLLNILGKTGADSDTARSRIAGANDLKGLRNLLNDVQRQDLSKNSNMNGLAGVGTPEFQKALEDAIRSQESLQKSLEEQNRAINENTKALEDDYRLKNSRTGGTDYYTGQLEKAETALNNAIERNDTPDIIQSLKTALELAKVGARYQAGGSVLGYDTGVLRTRLSESRELSLRNIEATRALASGKNANLVSGSMLQTSEFDAAKIAGQDGKSIESLVKGFDSVFVKMKKDFADLSELGANLGQSLSNSLSGAFGDFVTGAKSGKDAFRSFAISVLSDASRMFANQAVQGILGSLFGGISSPAGVNIGAAKTMPFAAGGKVPAMLTGGEYYIGPKAAKSIGYDTLHRLNGYADGGIVRGGSGVKDDVPAKLPPGSFIVKKSAVNKLGPDYLDSLVNGKVQHRFFGGFLLGSLLGGGIGALTGGKKGAIAGALLGGIGGGLAQNFAQSGSLFQSGTSGQGLFSFAGNSTAGAAGAPIEVGYGQYGAGPVAGAAAKAPMSLGAKLALGLGASAVLGGVSSLLAPKKDTFTPMNAQQISANRKSMEANQPQTPAGLYPWLSRNSNGGSNLMGYVPPTRLFADGGMVDNPAGDNSGPMSYASPVRPFANGGVVDSMTSSGSNLMGYRPPVRLFADGGMADSATGGGVDMGAMPMNAPNRGGGSSSNVSVKIEINNNGQTSATSSSSNKDGQGGFGADFAQKLQKQVQSIVQQELVTQSRSDGFFSQKSRYVQR